MQLWSEDVVPDLMLIPDLVGELEGQKMGDGDWSGSGRRWSVFCVM